MTPKNRLFWELGAYLICCLLLALWLEACKQLGVRGSLRG